MAADKTDDPTKRSDQSRRGRTRTPETSQNHRSAENLPHAGREYDDYTLADPGSAGEEPDVLLDVPVLKVDEINLDVEELRARVSLQAEVLDLLKLNVGADVAIGQVGLEIKGVEAQALLKVRLDNVARIVDRVLTTIDRNPEIIEQVTAGVRSAVEDLSGGVGTAVGDLGEGAGAAVEKLAGAEGARQTVRRTASRAAKTAKSAKAAARRRSAKQSSSRASDDQEPPAVAGH